MELPLSAVVYFCWSLYISFIGLFFKFLSYFEGLSSSKASFVETNIASNDHPPSGGIPQPTHLRSIPNIAHMCTFLALRLRFPSFLVGNKLLCIAAENFNVGQVRLYTVPLFIGGHVIEGTCWAPIMKLTASAQKLPGRSASSNIVRAFSMIV